MSIIDGEAVSYMLHAIGWWNGMQPGSMRWATILHTIDRSKFASKQKVSYFSLHCLGEMKPSHHGYYNII
jgi:hypothetical protein